jgi:hypothetical protein
MSRDCPRRTEGGTRPLYKARTAETAETPKTGITIANAETNDERIQRLVKELQALDGDGQDKVLGAAFTENEDF